MGTSPAIDLMDRWIGELCSYNFAALSFHIKKLCSRLFSREVKFYRHKQRYRVLVLPFGVLRVNVHGSSMARWKALGRLPIGDNWTFFASYHGWGAMSRYWSKLRCRNWKSKLQRRRNVVEKSQWVKNVRRDRHRTVHPSRSEPLLLNYQ